MRADAKMGILIGTVLAVAAGWYFWGSERPGDAIELGTWRSPIGPEARASVQSAAPFLRGQGIAGAQGSSEAHVGSPSGATPVANGVETSPEPFTEGLSEKAEKGPLGEASLDAAVPMAVIAPISREPRWHTIEAGDNFALLAEKYYGNQGRPYVDRLVVANPGVDPDRLKIGQRVVIPAWSVIGSAVEGNDPQAGQAGPSASSGTACNRM